MCGNRSAHSQRGRTGPQISERSLRAPTPTSLGRSSSGSLPRAARSERGWNPPEGQASVTVSFHRPACARPCVRATRGWHRAPSRPRGRRQVTSPPPSHDSALPLPCEQAFIHVTALLCKRGPSPAVASTQHARRWMPEVRKTRGRCGTQRGAGRAGPNRVVLKWVPLPDPVRPRGGDARADHPSAIP